MHRGECVQPISRCGRPASCESGRPATTSRSRSATPMAAIAVPISTWHGSSPLSWVSRAEFVATKWADLDSDFAANKFDIAVGGVTILARAGEDRGLLDGNDGRTASARSCVVPTRTAMCRRQHRPARRAGRGEPRRVQRGVRPRALPACQAHRPRRQCQRVRRDRGRAGGRDGHRRDRGGSPGIACIRNCAPLPSPPRSPGSRRPSCSRRTRPS